MGKGCLETWTIFYTKVWLQVPLVLFENPWLNRILPTALTLHTHRESTGLTCCRSLWGCISRTWGLRTLHVTFRGTRLNHRFSIRTPTRQKRKTNVDGTTHFLDLKEAGISGASLRDGNSFKIIMWVDKLGMFSCSNKESNWNSHWTFESCN